MVKIGALFFFLWSGWNQCSRQGWGHAEVRRVRRANRAMGSAS